MCELFGISSARKCPVNEYLKEFFSHSVRHPHGWGMASVSRNNVQIEKESIQASKSNYLKERLSQPIENEILIAHIRYATIGNVEYKNCHPFSGTDNMGRYWTLAHNGTIFDYPALNGYISRQKGDTDSERIFLYLIDRLNEAQYQKGARLTFEERFGLFDSIICEMAKGNKLNLLFTDGKYLYVHTNCKNTLYYLMEKDFTVISTQPLNSQKWENIPFAQLTAFHKGKLIQAGTAHTNEYIEDKDAIKLLYQIFANL